MVVGAGAREHALALALGRSPSVHDVLLAPRAPTPGVHEEGPLRCVPLPSSDAAALVELARREQVDLVVVGPEGPLTVGLVDALAEAGIDAFGPTRQAAALEGSKAFLKRFAHEHGIPTAPFRVVDDLAEAERYIAARGRPVVVKADGLCGGKGVVVAASPDEAIAAAREMLVEGRFGEAGRTVVIEDRLEGVELSVHAITDGDRMLVLPVARDHKRVADGDRGPNTGGMGAYAPVAVDEALMARVASLVLEPTLAGMRARGAPFRGVLYAGLMVSPDGVPYLLEHNVRFGDPETQVLLSLVDGDLARLLRSAACGSLDAGAVQIAQGRHALTVVLAARGYPGAPPRGAEGAAAITGLADAAALEGVRVYQAATSTHDGKLLAGGGRVLSITAVGPTLDEARARAYEATALIHFDGMQHRRDIGAASTQPADTKLDRQVRDKEAT